EVVTYTVTVAGGMSTATEHVENEVTIATIKQIAAKYGIKEFKVSAKTAETGMMRPLGGSSFPYKGDVLIQEYNAPKEGDTFTITIGAVTIPIQGAITLDDVKNVAFRHGFHEFEVRVDDVSSDRDLSPCNFPVTADIVITRYRQPENDVFTSRALFTTEGVTGESDRLPAPVTEEEPVDEDEDEEFDEDEEDEENEDEEDEENEDEEDEEDEEDDEDADEDEEVFAGSDASGSYIFSSTPDCRTIIVVGKTAVNMEQVPDAITVTALKQIAVKYGIRNFKVFMQPTTPGPMQALTTTMFPVSGNIVLREEL
ncbi:MAG: hypothetical protein PHR28_11860, partial [candidate division Zixibacteria bacterium]|nr:hypothetical protein [candidate division Zixibacteria bacterium]